VARKQKSKRDKRFPTKKEETLHCVGKHIAHTRQVAKMCKEGKKGDQGVGGTKRQEQYHAERGKGVGRKSVRKQNLGRFHTNIEGGKGGGGETRRKEWGGGKKKLLFPMASKK